jgi:hypothetical protein
MTPVSPASDELVRLVRRCRRRLAWIAFIRYGCISVAAAVALSAAVSVLLPGHSLTPRGIGMASLLGCAVAAALAGLRAPTLAATGTELDRRLNLSDAVVAALQFRESSEPIAALVVQAAAARVSGVVPARVFPARPGRSAMIAAAVVIAALALSSFRDSETDVATPGSGPSDAWSTASGRLEGSQSSSRGDARRGGTLRAAPTTALPSGREPAGARSGGDRSRARHATDEAGSAAPAERATSPTPAIDAPAPGPSTPRRNSGDTPSRGTSASNDAGSASPDRRSGRGSGAASPADVRTQGGPGASAEGSTTTTAAGGVQRGRLSPDRHRLEQASAMSSGSTSSNGAARAGTEAALSRDEVPPHLRPFVRTYFEAIRAQERK